MAPGSEEGPLQDMAWCHCRGDPTLPSQIQSNNAGTFGPTKEKHTINETKR